MASTLILFKGRPLINRDRFDAIMFLIAAFGVSLFVISGGVLADVNFVVLTGCAYGGFIVADLIKLAFTGKKMFY